MTKHTTTLTPTDDPVITQSILERTLEEAFERNNKIILEEMSGIFNDFARHIDERFKRGEVRLDRSEARLDASEARLQQSETRLKRSEARLKQSEQRLDKNEQRFDTLEVEVGRLIIKVRGMERRLADPEEDTSNLHDKYERAIRALDAHLKRFADTGTDDAARNEHLARSQQWVQELAKNAGIKLSAKQAR